MTPAGWGGLSHLGPALPLLGAALLLAIYAWRVEAARTVLSRAAAVGVPVILVGAAVIASGFLTVPEADRARIVQAGVAGGVLALGWIFSFAVTEYQREVERRRRMTDVMIALRSEIFLVVERMDQRPIRADAASTEARIRAGGAGAGAFVPFSISQSPAVIHEALGDAVLSLPAEAVEPVIRFYTAFSDLSAVLSDVQSARFAVLSPERRIGVYRTLTDHRRATLTWGLRAVVALNAALGVEDPAGFARSGKNPDIVP